MSNINPSNQVLEGVGLGLREAHLNQVIHTNHSIKWFELILDNWLSTGGFVASSLAGIIDKFPVTLHGVGLSPGSLDPLNMDYLKQVKNLINQTGAIWYSEHCSFSSFAGQQVPDLLPLPYTEEALTHLSQRINQVQDYLGQPILIENVSSYVTAPNNEYSEAQFLAELVKKTDCYLLLDLCNIHISCHNHGYDAQNYLSQLPINSIRQLHLAGFHQEGHQLIDSHSAMPSDDIWELYEYFLIEHANDIPTLIEWDNQLPAFNQLIKAQQKAESILQKVLLAKAVPA